MRELQSWKWKAADLEGRVVKGTWDYADVVEVRQGLKERGLYLIDIRPQSKLFERLWFAHHAKTKWIRLVKNLALLLEAGIPLLQALDILCRREPGHLSHSPEQLRLVKNKIQEGLDLSEAINILQPQPDSFIRFMIRAGEQSGTLVQALDEIASSLETDVYLNRKIKAALAYPLILLGLTIIILIGLGLWILPMYENIFANLNGEIPILTSTIFGIGQYLPGVVFGVMVALGGGITAVALVPKIRLSLIKGLRKLPLWGSILRLADEEQFSRILGRLLRAGIPIREALNLMRDSEFNSGIQDLVEELRFAVNEGRRLAPVLKMNWVFSSDKCEMFRTGEESGKLEESLMLMSKWSRMEFEERFDGFSRLLEPLLIIVMAGLIGLVAVGVLLPVLQAPSFLH